MRGRALGVFLFCGVWCKTLSADRDEGAGLYLFFWQAQESLEFGAWSLEWIFFASPFLMFCYNNVIDKFFIFK